MNKRGWRFPNLLEEKRSVSYAIAFGIWAEVFVWALLHDQYLIRIAPEHFTVYHEPLWGIEDLTLLAAAWAFRGSLAPGLILGMAALFAARAGSSPKIDPARLLKTLPFFLVATEIAGLAAGTLSWATQRPLYPATWYPELTPALLATQSIQITCYIAGIALSAVYVTAIVKSRRRKLRPSDKTDTAAEANLAGRAETGRPSRY